MRNEQVYEKLKAEVARLKEAVMESLGKPKLERVDGGTGQVPWEKVDFLPFAKKWLRGFDIAGGPACGAKAVMKGLGIAVSELAEAVKETHISNLLYRLAHWLDVVEVPELQGVPWAEFLEAVEQDCSREYIEPGKHAGCTLAEFLEAVYRQYMLILRRSEHLWLHSPWQSIEVHDVIGPRTTDGKKLMFLPHVLSPFAHAILRYAMWRNEGTGIAGEELPREVGTLSLPDDLPFSHP